MTQEELNREKERVLASLGEHALAQKTEVRWNPRMRSAAGRAHLRQYRIELNPRLLEEGLWEVQRTLLHELAHLLAWKRSRCHDHGAAWRQACSDLGIPGESVTHQLPFPVRRQRKRWEYRCTNCQSTLQRVRQAKRPIACAKCCNAENGGRFSKRFLLVERKLDPPAPN